MADEEILEGGEEPKDLEEQAPEAVEAEAAPEESGGEAEQVQDQPAEAAAEESEESPQAEVQDAPDSEEKSVDDLVEQQMLAELEKVESEDGQEVADPSGEGTVLSADKGEINEQDVQLPEYPAFGKTSSTAQQKNLDLLLDVNLPISIELGRTSMRIKDILSLGPGSVVELKKLAGEPVDLLVNNKIVAKGEVVVVDENFGLRITSLLSPEERLRSLND